MSKEIATHTTACGVVVKILEYTHFDNDKEKFWDVVLYQSKADADAQQNEIIFDRKNISSARKLFNAIKENTIFI